jgi:peptidoglycan/xylan/chitin deacetylase (PgdA/CDA1 family)
LLPGQAARRLVAITIDDLPMAQSGPDACDYPRLLDTTRRLLQPIRDARIPVTAFVIGTNCPDLTAEQRRTVLQLWRSAGALLGNHTYSHRPLREARQIEEYEADILKQDMQLRSLFPGEDPRWFRSPLLFTGPDRASKERLERFLAAHQYRQAPVTFDNSDWVFANAWWRAAADPARRARVEAEYIPYMESVVAHFERLSRDLLGREIPQVLLMHSSEFNARMLPHLIAMFRRRGYEFAPLDHVVRDPAYAQPDEYAGLRGISWLHRWSITRGQSPRWEPDEPKWLTPPP